MVAGLLYYKWSDLYGGGHCSGNYPELTLVGEIWTQAKWRVQTTHKKINIRTEDVLPCVWCKHLDEGLIYYLFIYLLIFEVTVAKAASLCQKLAQNVTSGSTVCTGLTKRIGSNPEDVGNDFNPAICRLHLLGNYRAWLSVNVFVCLFVLFYCYLKKETLWF